MIGNNILLLLPVCVWVCTCMYVLTLSQGLSKVPSHPTLSSSSGSTVHSSTIDFAYGGKSGAVRTTGLLLHLRHQRDKNSNWSHTHPSNVKADVVVSVMIKVLEQQNFVGFCLHKIFQRENFKLSLWGVQRCATHCAKQHIALSKKAGSRLFLRTNTTRISSRPRCGT